MYKDNVYWRLIEGFMPEENRISVYTTPEEKWYTHKGMKIPLKGVANTRMIVNRKDLLSIMLKDKTGSGSSVSIGFLISMMNMVPLIEPENFTICPVLLAHPEMDHWTPVEISRLFFDRIQADKEVILLENAGHFPIESPGLQQLADSAIDFIKCR